MFFPLLNRDRMWFVNVLMNHSAHERLDSLCKLHFNCFSKLSLAFFTDLLSSSVWLYNILLKAVAKAALNDDYDKT